MKHAKGFRGRYFSLSAITALNAQNRTLSLFAQARSGEAFTRHNDHECETDEAEKPQIASFLLAAALVVLPAAAVAAEENATDPQFTPPPQFTPQPITVTNPAAPTIRAIEAESTTLKNYIEQFSALSQSSTQNIGSFEGAPPRFGAIFWEGINIEDGAAIDRQATFVNNLAIGGDRIGAAFGATQSAIGAGSSGALMIFADKNAPSEVSFGASNMGESFQNARVNIGKYGYLSASHRFMDGYSTAVKKAGELDTSSEKDAIESANIRGKITIPIKTAAEIDIKLLHAAIDEDYDGSPPPFYASDPDDSAANFKTRFTLQGYEARFLDFDNLVLSAGWHSSRMTREDAGSDTYESKSNKQFAYVDLFFNKIDMRLGVEQKEERASISNQMDGKNNHRDIYAIAQISAANNKLDLSLRNSRFSSNYGDRLNSYSFRAAWSVILGNFSAVLSQARAINPPSLYQQINPWGVSSHDLKYEIFDQTRAEGKFDIDSVEISASIWSTRIKDYINWVEIPPYSGIYENIDRVELKGWTIKSAVKPIDNLSFGGEFTRLFDYESSVPSIEDRQSKRTAIAYLRYAMGDYYAAIGARFGGGYYDGASGEKMKGERENYLSIGYKDIDKLNLELSVKNLTNDYRERVYGYSPATPERTIFLTLKKQL
ncbi:hypothetical protein FACS189487_04290 [Campylobacterota bacterium]|nr:hypothetical protein FACS189487_04290 [Campylobacterota bacterium]